MKLLPAVLLFQFLSHATAQDSRLINQISTKPYKVLKGHKNKVQRALIRPNGKFIISNGWDNTVKLWDARIFSEKKTFTGHTDQVW